MEAEETVCCRGHPSVLGTHPTTFEVTVEGHLEKTGNCIIGVAADKGCAGLSSGFRKMLAHDDAVLITRLTCNNIEVTIRSQGSAQLTLDHPTDMVWRRSAFICGRTIGIHADHVAATLPADLITCLKAGHAMVVTLKVTRPG